jgi:putative transposase
VPRIYLLVRAFRSQPRRHLGIAYLDGGLAQLVDHRPGKLRVEYDPRDFSEVFVELPAGDHVQVPYADISRQPITLWEHREALKRLRAEGRRSVDEHAIFASVAE